MLAALVGCERTPPSPQPAPAAAKPAASAKPTRGWVCDMACEGCKTFDGPGKCPVCKMDLRPYEEVPFSGRLALSVQPQVGQPLDLRMTLTDPAGCPVDPAAFDKGAGRAVNAVILSREPGYLGKPGVILEPGGVVRLTGASPTAGGRHLALCVFAPPGLPPQAVSAEFEVPGPAKPTAPAAASDRATLRAGELVMQNEPPRLRVERDNSVYIRPAVLPKVGAPAPLRLAGAQAALVRDDLGYAGPGTIIGKPSDQVAAFGVYAPSAAAYRLLVWLDTAQGADVAEFWIPSPLPPRPPQGVRPPPPLQPQTPREQPPKP